VYAESGELSDAFTLTDLVGFMGECGQTLIRAKGVIQGRSFDFTQGSLRWGASSSLSSHATFISTEPLRIIAQDTRVEGSKKTLMRGYQVPVEATEAALKWQLAEYPNNRTVSGEIRVDCEADIVRQLCEREGVSLLLRAQAIQQYVAWRLKSLRALNAETSVWSNHQDYAYWQRRLGAVLCWHAVNVPDQLTKEQLSEINDTAAARHAFEGLLGLTELSFDEERAEERPELILDCINLAHRHGSVDFDLIGSSVMHCLTLSRPNGDWHNRWSRVYNTHF
jgi:hypothetical protein